MLTTKEPNLQNLPRSLASQLDWCFERDLGMPIMRYAGIDLGMPVLRYPSYGAQRPSMPKRDRTRNKMARKSRRRNRK